MTNAKTDNNNVPTAIGVLNTDGATPTPLRANPTTHALDVVNGSTGSDAGNDLSVRDDNVRSTMLATDGSENIITLFVDSSGKLLVKTT